jgi:hypothetical protein
VNWHAKDAIEAQLNAENAGGRVDVQTKKWCWQKQKPQAKMCCKKKSGRKKCEARERRRKGIAARVGTLLHWIKKIKHIEVACRRGIKILMMRGGVPPWHQKFDDACKYFLLP